MSELFRSTPTTGPGEAVDPRRMVPVLSAEVRRALAARNGACPEGVLRIAVPVPDVDPYAWLAAHPAPWRWFWSGRKVDHAVAAVGVADVLEGENMAAVKERLAARLAGAPRGLRYYGGLRFDASMSPAPEWEAFGVMRFVLPRFELHRAGGVTRLVCNLVPARDRAQASALCRQIESLALPMEPHAGMLPLPTGRTDHPGREGWNRNIEWALSAFDSGDLDKIVLARKATYSFAETLDPVALLQQLQAATPGCFHYLIEPAPGCTFVGATPERLFRREGDRVWSEAVAGTRPRGDTLRADAELREELLHSEKEQREHAYVRDRILEVLSPHCVDLRIDPAASEMRLAQGRHLVSAVEGTLRSGVDSLDLLAALHPTPAVGGVPRPRALEAIRRLEPFDRGWYAGPIGWIGADVAEFAVALRCGLVQDHSLSLFSGAGIVAGSTPQSEWDEIECKIQDFVNVLGLDLRRTQ